MSRDSAHTRLVVASSTRRNSHWKVLRTVVTQALRMTSVKDSWLSYETSQWTGGIHAPIARSVRVPWNR